MKYQWKLAVNYVPFQSDAERNLSYERYAESILNGLRNKKKAKEAKGDKKERTPRRASKGMKPPLKTKE